MSANIFQNRRLIIATRHQKDRIIAPVLERELGVHCFTDPDLDTDALGTFTGEVERVLDPVSAAREKCLRAMQLHGCDLGVASEGSFGPHPSMYFIPADDEFLIFMDLKNQLEIIVRELSTDTNFGGAVIGSEEELQAFAEKAGFPSHGLILRKSKDDASEIYKGITDADSLRSAFAQLRNKYATVYVETDMRAMYNPTRMKVIENAARKLADKIKSVCPSCSTPGFGIAEVKKGLLCSLCGLPTNSTYSHIYRCAHCHFQKEVVHPYGKTTEDPMYCDFCNP